MPCLRRIQGALVLRDGGREYGRRGQAHRPRDGVRARGERNERDHRVRKPGAGVGAMPAAGSMTGFSMPRVAIPATLLQTAGGKKEGEVYVMERVPQHAGHETPLDMLNRADAFFPFRAKDEKEGVLLVAKTRTVTLTVPRPDDEDSA